MGSANLEVACEEPLSERPPTRSSGDELLITNDIDTDLDELQPDFGALALACAECGKRAATLSRCAKCKVVRYCSRECQLAGWHRGGHKTSCGKPLPTPESVRDSSPSQVQRTLAESSHFQCARHAQSLKILHFFHANFAARCASSRFYTCAFLGFECISDPVNIFSDAMSTLADGLQILCARCGVCECSTHANQEMSSSEADVHSPVRSRPYCSKI